MIYDIKLSIQYVYRAAVAGGRHVLYMTPSQTSKQRVITSLLDISPAPDERIAKTDFFGNTAVEVAFRAPHAEIAFRLRARVERLAEEEAPDVSPSMRELMDEIAGLRSLTPDSPYHFLADSPRVKVRPEFKDYARAQVADAAQSVRAIVEAVGMALDRDMTFDPGSTNVDTPPEEAFAARHGVCQDFTHIMIGCLRSIGIPSGYVSGFLRTQPPEGEERLEGADAMHAWVRAWCGVATGWIEFDPTNGIPVSDQHIAVGHGRDYSDVAPVRGVVRTSGGQASKQAVDVIPLGGS